MSQILDMAKLKSIGKFMVKIRNDRGISQRDLAALIDTTGPYIAQIEADKYRYPMETVKILNPILTKKEKAQLLEILVDYLKEDCGL